MYTRPDYSAAEYDDEVVDNGCESPMAVIRKEARRYHDFDGTVDSPFPSKPNPFPMMFGDPQHLPYATAEQTYEEFYGAPSEAEFEMRKKPLKTTHELFGSDYMVTDNPRERAYRETFGMRTADSEGFNYLGDQLARGADVRYLSLNRYEVKRQTNNGPALAAEPGIAGGPGGAAPKMFDYHLGKLGNQRVQYETAISAPYSSTAANGEGIERSEILPTSRITDYEPRMDGPYGGSAHPGISGMNDYLVGARMRGLRDDEEFIFTGGTGKSGMFGSVETNPHEGGRMSMMHDFEITPLPAAASGGMNSMGRNDYLGGVRWTKTDRVDGRVPTMGRTNAGDFGGIENFGATVMAKLRIGPVNPSVMIPSTIGRGVFLDPEIYSTLRVRTLKEEQAPDGTPDTALLSAALENDERIQAKSFRGVDLDELDFVFKI